MGLLDRLKSNKNNIDFFEWLDLLLKRLVEVQRAMEEKLSEMTLADVKKEIAAYTEKE